MKRHWENIYSTKQPNELSWTQNTPQISLDLIKSLNLSKSSSIIDIGAGQSMLVDSLIDLIKSDGAWIEDDIINTIN